MEMEFFIPPGEDDKWYDYWIEERFQWYVRYGVRPDKLRKRPHADDELAHYSTGCTDVEYEYPFGWGELEGIAKRTDYDLKAHSEGCGKPQTFFDEQEKKHYTPHVIEPAAGCDRTAMTFLVDAYEEQDLSDPATGKQDSRTVLHFHPEVAPITVAVFPLVKKEGMPEVARGIVRELQEAGIRSFYDQKGAIGRRYRRQDEIGTPYCITVDGDTLADETVTLRDRDTMEQVRLPADDVEIEIRRRMKDWTRQ